MAFAPTDIANLVAWWKADAITGLANGAGVSSWPDSSGNARNLAQATSARQPSYQQEFPDFLPVVRFAGDDFMPVSWTLIAQPITVFLVASMPTITADQYFYDGFSTARCALFWAGQATEDQTLHLYSGTEASMGIGAPLPFAAYVAIHNGASSFLYRNGVDVGGGARSVNTQGLDGFTLGARLNSATFGLIGDVGEAGVYSRAITTVERTNLQDYLLGRWRVFPTAVPRRMPLGV